MNSRQHSSQVIDPNVAIEQIEKGKVVKVDRGRLFSNLKGTTLDMFLGTFGSAMTGALNPATGFILAMSINALSSPDDDTIKKDGLFYSIMYLLVAVVNGFCMFLKIWRFCNIAVKTTSTLRKKVV